MTRYSCLWVENGKFVAPINDLRFDDSLYNLFGKNLEAVTDQVEFIPNTMSYERRALGGYCCPGILVTEMNFTL